MNAIFGGVSLCLRDFLCNEAFTQFFNHLIKGQCMKSYCLENKKKFFCRCEKIKSAKKDWMPFSVEYL